MKIQDSQIAQLKGSSILYVGRSKQIAPWRWHLDQVLDGEQELDENRQNIISRHLKEITEQYEVTENRNLTI